MKEVIKLGFGIVLFFPLVSMAQDEYIVMRIDDVSETTSIAFWQLRFGYDLAGGDANFFHNHGINTTLNGRRNTVLKTATGLRYEITDLLYLNFEVQYDYESNPATDAEKKDVGILAGFGLEFLAQPIMRSMQAPPNNQSPQTGRFAPADGVSRRPRHARV